MNCELPAAYAGALRQFVRESEHRPAQREVFKRLHLGMWLDGAASPAFDLAVWDEGNPLLRWCVGNLVFVEDASGNRRPHKGKSIDRIDCAVASIMAIGRAAANATGSASYVTESWSDGLAFA